MLSTSRQSWQEHCSSGLHFLPPLPRRLPQSSVFKSCNFNFPASTCIDKLTTISVYQRTNFRNMKFYCTFKQNETEPSENTQNRIKTSILSTGIYILAIMTFMAYPRTLCATAQRFQQSTCPAFKYILKRQALKKNEAL